MTKVQDAAAVMLHAVTNPLVVKAMSEGAQLTPTEAALVTAMEAVVDFSQVLQANALQGGAK